MLQGKWDTLLGGFDLAVFLMQLHVTRLVSVSAVLRRNAIASPSPTSYFSVW
jgi:hypothetical protein